MIHGSLTGRYYGYIQPAETLPHQHWGEIDLKLELSKNLTDNISYALLPRVRFDTAGFAQGVMDGFREDANHRYNLNIDEAWVRYTDGEWFVTAGKNIFGWGTADGYNPTDNLNPIDFTDVPNSEKIGMFALAFTYAGDLAELEAVFVPWFTPSRLPNLDNRWIGDLSAMTQAFAPFNPVLGDRELPSASMENVQFALRLSSSTLVEGWDLAFSYFDGLDPVGVLRSDPAPPAVNLTRIFPHVRKVGFDFSTVFGSIEVHGEASAHLTRDNAMDDDYVEFIAGINYGFDDLTLPPFLEELRITLEYGDEYVLDEKQEDTRYIRLDGFVRPLNRSILGSLLIKLSEETACEINGGVNLNHYDHFLEPILRHKITDTLELEVGCLIINGPSGSFYGRWRDNDRVSATLTKHF